MRERASGWAILAAWLGCGVSGGFAAPAIEITREGEQVRIVFTGRLERAESVGGPWSEAGDGSPWIEPVTGGARFYRAVEPESIFASGEVVALTVTGPLQAHFDLAFAGLPDGIFPPVREKPWFEGTVRAGSRSIPVTLRVRGSSSLQECPFAKLKFKVSRANREGTPFLDAREVKIGTHCAEGGRGSIGRLREEIAAAREALAYEVMRELGFAGPRVRRARIEYRDTSLPDGESERGWVITRDAFLFDDVEVVAERLGGRALKDEEVADLRDANFDEQLVLEIWLLHALLGNWDYVLGTDGFGLWNTEVIELPDKTLLPVAGDFDLASWVTEETRLSAPWDYRPELPDLERQAMYEVEEIRKRASEESFAAAREKFKGKKDDLASLVESARVDEIGRATARRHLAAFFAALEGSADGEHRN